MLFVLAILLTTVPAAFLLIAGLWVLPKNRNKNRYDLWIQVLLITAIIVLLPIALAAEIINTSRIGLFLILLLPALEGVFALLLVQWREVHALWLQSRRRISIQLFLIILLIFSTASGELTYPLVLILPAIVLALLWNFGSRLGMGKLLLSCAVILAWNMIKAVGLIGHRLNFAPLWQQVGYQVLEIGLTVLSFGLMAVIIYKAVFQFKSGDRRRSYFLISLFILLTFGLGAEILRHGVMVNATSHGAEDHLPFGAVMLAIISGMILTASLVGKSRIVGTLYLLFIPIFIFGIYCAGWWIQPHKITSARAARLEKAIELFHQKNGVYPADLKDLTPNYIPFILGPLSGRAQVWCYQGGQDYYRLGYIFIQRYYHVNYPDPFFEVRINASHGQPLDKYWMCDEEIQRVKVTRGL